jgi:hypothetical protein
MSVLFGLVIQTNGFWPKELQPKWKHLLLVASNMAEKQSWGNIAVGAAAGFLMFFFAQASLEAMRLDGKSRVLYPRSSPKPRFDWLFLGRYPAPSAPPRALPV